MDRNLTLKRELKRHLVLNLDVQDIAAVMVTCAIMEENVWRSIMVTPVIVRTQPTKDPSARKVGRSFDPKSLSVSDIQHSFTHESLVSPMLQEDVLISAVPSTLLFIVSSL